MRTRKNFQQAAGPTVPAAPAPAGARLQLAAGAALAVLLAVVYLASWPPDITFEDTPIFAAACYTRGLAHPPGYPLHTLLCWPLAQLADYLPLSIAQASALASLIPAVAACLLLARLAAGATGSLPAALLAAGLLGLAPAFWRQAIIPESYALNAFLIAAAWTAADAYVKSPRPAMLLALALLTGLGLANHWPLFVLPAPALLLWLLPARRRLRDHLSSPRLLAAIAAAFAAGLLPYLHLYFPAAEGYRFISDTQEKGLYWYVSRQAYSGQNPAGDYLARIPEMGQALLLVVQQYAYVFAAAGLFGLRQMRRSGQIWQAAAVLWAVFSCTLVLAFFRPLSVNEFLAAEIFSVYPLPAYLWFALPVAAAAAWLLRRLAPAGQWACCALVLAVTAAGRFPGVDRSFDDVAFAHANRLLQSLPADATLLVPPADFYFGLSYLQRIVGIRGDVRLRKENELFEQIDSGLELTAEQQQRLADIEPVAFISDFQLGEQGRTMHGAYFTPGGNASGDTAVHLDDQDRQHYRRLIEAAAADRYSNGWTRRFVLQEVGELARHLADAAGRQELAAADGELLTLALALPAGRYGRFIAEATSGRRTPQQVVEDAIVVEEDFPELYSQWRGRVLHISGYAFFLQGDIEASAELFEQSLAQFPSEDNFRAIIDLLQVYAFLKRFDDYRRLRRRFAGLDTGTALASQDAACARHFSLVCAPDVKESAP